MIVPIQYANLLNIKLNEPIIRVDSLISHKTGMPYVLSVHTTIQILQKSKLPYNNTLIGVVFICQ